MDDPLRDLHNYSSEMSVSQVIKFFERKGFGFTKTMIQNYVRVGVLEPPDGRAYGARHMRALVMIELLKPVYSLDEIKRMLADMDIGKDYALFFEAFNTAADFWRGRGPGESASGFMLEAAAFAAATKRVTRGLAGDGK